jgi:hypothetical protein
VAWDEVDSILLFIDRKRDSITVVDRAPLGRDDDALLLLSLGSYPVLVAATDLNLEERDSEPSCKHEK